MYYGKGFPCGKVTADGTLLVPEYGPRLYIYPSLQDPEEFRFWSLRFLSMTLLEPLVENPDHGLIDPLQWASKRIVMPSVEGEERTGIRVVFDSCEYLQMSTSELICSLPPFCFR